MAVCCVPEPAFFRAWWLASTQQGGSPLCASVGHLDSHWTAGTLLCGCWVRGSPSLGATWGISAGTAARHARYHNKKYRWQSTKKPAKMAVVQAQPGFCALVAQTALPSLYLSLPGTSASWRKYLPSRLALLSLVLAGLFLSAFPISHFPATPPGSSVISSLHTSPSDFSLLLFQVLEASASLLLLLLVARTRHSLDTVCSSGIDRLLSHLRLS